MPKKVFDHFVEQIANDINQGYAPGDRYLSTRKIAEKFNVSLQTAHRGIRMFAKKGILEAKAKSGIIIKSLHKNKLCTRKTVLVVSDNPDRRFNEAFMKGINAVLARHGMAAVLEVNTETNTKSLSFGERLMGLYSKHHAAAIIALYFRDTDLAFYHVINQGIPVITDIISDNLPLLASVQTSNSVYCQKAAERFIAWKKKEILVCSFWDCGNKRHRYFADEIGKIDSSIKLLYLDLKDQHYPAKLFSFFELFNKGKGIFSLDYSANYAITPYLMVNDIQYHRNLLVYDSEEDDFYFKSRKIEAVAPSLRKIGETLATKLMGRLQSGKWQEPLNERI